MKSLLLTSLSLFWLTSSGLAQPHGQIRVSADSLLTSVGACLEQNVPLRLYVVAELFGTTAGGIRGAEYRITTSETTDWLYLEDFAPSVARGGLLFGDHAVQSRDSDAAAGINIAFATCQNGPFGYVVLQTVEVLDLSGSNQGVPVQLLVEAHSSPGNPFFRCPLVNLCDDPAFTKVCVGFQVTTEVCPFPPGALACFESTSGFFDINYDDPNTGGYVPCDVAVETTTWSSVKSLYGDGASKVRRE